MIDPRRVLSLGATWLVPVAAVVTVGVGTTLGLGPGLLVLAGAALLGAVLLLWSSLERLTGESPLSLDEAIGLGAPSPEEEKKRSIVRALKDLEYERSVGKISEADYAELTTRYRGEAKALLRTLDTELGKFRKTAEERLAARLEKEGLVAPAPVTGTESAGELRESGSPRGDGTGEPANRAPAATECPACQTKNDPDATFCKRCGTRVREDNLP